ncbi:MAG TPA: MtrB/PioB family outer membrane beta-barrel protein [Gemmatimonadaceae bacterium]|nr:MtrB/PioB family outer membrane beta-barrel protein [Gemmatimonadaceae bacterium]
MRITAIAATIGAVASALAPARSASAQVPGSLDGSVELGGRSFTQNLDKQQLGYFNLYKDVPEGAVLQQLMLRYFTPDSLRQMEFVARQVGTLDQSLWFRANQPGLFDFQVRSDRIPHTFSTTARFLGTEASPGVYTLPSPRPDTATLNHSAYLGPMRTVWDPTKVSLAFTPNTSWDMKADYTRIDKSGSRPMGMAFVGSGGNSREIPEPIDQTVQGLRVAESYASDRYQLVGTYDLSVFTNHLSSVTSDNPWAVTDGTSMAARGRTALPPSNVAHTVAGTGAFDLPFSTRVTTTGSYGWWKQNVPYIPATTNSTITDVRVKQIPYSLDALAQTSVFAASFSSRPASPLNLTGHFRSYVFRDHATGTVMPVMITNDRSVSAADSSERDPFRRDNGDIGASYRLPLVSATLAGSYNWEQMTLDSVTRNISRYTETGPRASIDFVGIDWATLRLSYNKAWRRAKDYHALAATDVQGFERFYLADRDRERVNLMADVTPIDAITIGGTWQVGHDRYPGSTYGILSDKNTAVGTDVSYAPSARVSLGAGWEREIYDDLQKNIYLYKVNGQTVYNTSFQWFAHNMDYTTTISADARLVVIPDRLQIGGTYEQSQARFRMLAYNPMTPSGGTAAQNTSATAHDYPDVSQKLQPVTAWVEYSLRADWAITLRYQGELFNQNDFRTAGLQPATGTFDFLGNNYMNYNAQFLTLAVSYRPWSIRRSRSTL